MSNNVDDYIANASSGQQDALRELRGMIRDALPHAEESICSSGFAVYTIDGDWAAGFATRGKGPMLYIMAKGVLDRFDDRLGSLRSGKSCVDYKASKTMTLDELRELVHEMLTSI